MTVSLLNSPVIIGKMPEEELKEQPILNPDGFAKVIATLIDKDKKEYRNLKVLIDTGAVVNVLSKALFDKISCDKNGTTKLGILGEEGEQDAQVYNNTKIYFDDADNDRKFNFVVLPIYHQDTDIILGTFFMKQHCDFIYNIQRGCFSFRILI
jgi:hypothetical protein